MNSHEFLDCFENYKLDFLNEKMYCTKINLCIRYFVKTQYFAIANLVHINKTKSRFAETLP